MPSSSASAKRKQDEKHYNILKELLAAECNKRCFDCGQRGPVYVNMTIGAFACTACSGLLRGMNTPHRVKSVSMASFTPEEMEFIQKRGNDACYCVWLGKYESRYGTEPFPESKDEHKLRDFLHKKYELKTWYVPEAKALADYEKVRKENQVSRSNASSTATKPSIPVPTSSVGSLLSKSGASSNTTNQQTPRPAPPSSKPASSTPVQQSSASKNNDLDLIFGSSAPAAPPVQHKTPLSQSSQKTQADPFASSTGSGGGNFDLFSNFSPPAPAPETISTLPPGLSQVPDNSILNSTFGQLTLSPTSATSQTSANPPVSSSTTALKSSEPKADKYAVLANLDEEIKSSTNKLSWSDSLTTPGSSGGIEMGNGSFHSMASPPGVVGSNQWSYASHGSGVPAYGDASFNKLGVAQQNQLTNPNPFAPSSASANPFMDSNWSGATSGVASFPNQNPIANSFPLQNSMAPESGYSSFSGAFPNAPNHSSMALPNQPHVHNGGGFANYQNASLHYPPTGGQFSTSHLFSPMQQVNVTQQNGGFTAFPNANLAQPLSSPFLTSKAAPVVTGQSNNFGGFGAGAGPQSNSWASPSQQRTEMGGAGPDPFASLASGFKTSNFAPTGSNNSAWPNQSVTVSSMNAPLANTASVKANPFMD